MGSVMGPGPAYTAYRPHSSNYAADHFAARGAAAAPAATPRQYRQQPQQQQYQRPNSYSMGDNAASQRSARGHPMSAGSYAQFDNSPVVYSQTGRPMSSSAYGGATTNRGSYDARLQNTTGHRVSYGSWDSQPRRPEYGWHRPALIKQQRRIVQPGEQFDALPNEVFELIMNELRAIHLASGSFSCATCMMRDLGSVALASRKLLKFARKALYEHIQLVGSDSLHQKKRYKINHGSRMILLRRTLRANPQIASFVKSFKPPAQPQGMPIDQYTNMVASIIMACPNLERLGGPYQSYDHNFSRQFHALSTRQNLKEMTWVVEASSSQTQRRARGSADVEPGDLHPQQSAAFLDLNMNWKNLTTLTIHCFPGASLTPVSLVSTAISTMPALQHLHLSHLPGMAFDDRDLLYLPALKTLSLSHLSGVTSNGLSAFAARATAQSLRKLTLRHMNVDSLPVLARIFLNLTSLESFCFIQSTTPILPFDESIWLFPYLASNSLRRLHWDITKPMACANIADTIFAKSIAAGGFPALRTLTTPNDPQGVYQDLCRPVERIDLPIDKYTGRGLVASAINARPTTPGTPSTPGKSPKTLFSPQQQSPGHGDALEATNLRQARLTAQSRVEAARKEMTRVQVHVTDEDGEVVDDFSLGGFIGSIPSQIEYNLLPEPGATDENGGLVLISDVLSDRGEDLADREGCTGRWNNYGEPIMDKKDKEKWWHTERARWVELKLN
ncbi:hypothetical protein BX600DRAFT_508337 [Xylariales sp. PMI_506]|nr:hypothetical protein BX600DRAFT_508337 [Xylariales sp. PMI_506]